MKKNRSLAILSAALCLSLLAGCGAKPAPAASAPAASVPTASIPAVSSPGDSAPASSAPAEPADYTHLVLDTSDDAGKLTVRYLAMKATYVADGDKINVGDCSVYTSPEGLVMMVDCSNPASFPEIDAQLQAMGVEEIDIFVMSHPHADHIGCFAELAEHYPIHQLYKNEQEYTSGTYSRTMAAAEEHDIPVTILHEGDTFSFGDEVEVTVFGPTDKMEQNITAMVDTTNNGSLALRIAYGESSFWTAGDTYVPGEQAIVAAYGDAIQSDVIKMNHHGYETSNNKDYVEALAPKVAVSMHESMTSKTVALRHSTRGAETFYTCMDGTVRVSTTGDGTYDVQTQLVRTQTVYGEPAADGHYVIQ